MRSSLLIFALLLITTSVDAQVAGDPCPKFGQTIVADDKKSVLACLRPTLGDPTSPLVWMLNTVAPKAWQADGGNDPDPFYKIGEEQKAR